MYLIYCGDLLVSSARARRSDLAIDSSSYVFIYLSRSIHTYIYLYMVTCSTPRRELAALHATRQPGVGRGELAPLPPATESRRRRGPWGGVREGEGVIRRGLCAGYTSSAGSRNRVNPR